MAKHLRPELNRSTHLGSVLASLFLLTILGITPALAQDPGAVGVRMIFSLPDVLSLGGQADVAVTPHLSLVASLHKRVTHGDCLTEASLPPTPQTLTSACDFDGLSFGGGLRLRTRGGLGSSPFLQIAAGRHQFETGGYRSPFLSLAGGFTWLTGSRGIVDVGIQHQWVREPVLQEGWKSTLVLQLAAGVQVG